MTTPLHKNCPHCTFAFPPHDSRFIVPDGQKFMLIVCPGCRTTVRLWEPGCSPSERKSKWPIILIAIVIIIVIASLRS